MNVYRWECGVLELIDNEDIGKMAAIAYRIVAKAGTKDSYTLRNLLAACLKCYRVLFNVPLVKK